MKIATRQLVKNVVILFKVSPAPRSKRPKGKENEMLEDMVYFIIIPIVLFGLVYGGYKQGCRDTEKKYADIIQLEKTEGGEK